MSGGKFILYYSHSSLPLEMEEYFQRMLLHAAGSIPVVAVMKRPRSAFSQSFANLNLTANFSPNSWTSILHQMEIGIDAILQRDPHATVYLAEHDVLYPRSYFQNVPGRSDVLLKNRQLYFLNKTGFIGPYKRFIHSQTIGSAALFKRCLLEDVIPTRKFKSANGYELISFDCEAPSLDVRHGYNFTGYREAENPAAYLQELPYWGNHASLAAQIPGFL